MSMVDSNKFKNIQRQTKLIYKHLAVHGRLNPSMVNSNSSKHMWSFNAELPKVTMFDLSMFKTISNPTKLIFEFAAIKDYLYKVD